MKRRVSRVVYLPDDCLIFENLVSTLGGSKKEKTAGEILLAVGKSFLGAPYVRHSLESEGEETLMVNLREFDCVTFVETSVALTLSILTGEPTFERYLRILQKVRYRGGIMRGYSSRLHYFSDWLFDNEKKGIVEEITPRLGGRQVRKDIKYMTRNREMFPRMNEEKVFMAMKAVERRISHRFFFVLPSRNIRNDDGEIRDGDIIALTAKNEGLDVLHVGFAVRTGRRLHLLHASEREGKVVVSGDPLSEYLRKNEASSGIRVARLVHEYGGR